MTTTTPTEAMPHPILTPIIVASCVCTRASTKETPAATQRNATTLLVMEYFTSILAAFCLVTLFLSQYSLLDAKGWFAVVVSFCGLIYVQRQDVRRAREQEGAEIEKKLHDFQKTRQERKEMTEWWTKEKARVYSNGGSDPTGEIFIKYTSLFDLTASIADRGILDELTSKNEEIMRLRQENGLKLKELYEKLNIEMTYNSNAMEGNRISRSETAMILSGLIGGEGKTLRELEDIVGHAKAFQKVQDLVATKKSAATISIRDILNIHELVLQNHSAGGKYRGEEEFVTVGNRKVLLAMPDEIEALMTKLVTWIRERQDTDYHPLLLATTVHYAFQRIHPFLDGNGLTARLLSNLILMRRGYPPIIIPVEKTETYLGALAAWDGGDPAPLVTFMTDLLKQMFSLYEKELR
ncbi:monophosphate-protein transferase FICD homolog [Seminavis robusta]|uniref:Monophosphate-protein transferase FICD homolog n=1 Tax=Seminavis robusta TaxID=568900 RepID=A0A9N8E9T9_9STRA|nr:monophosphate-protein transferase FICD homolog [Seminavis robusta]|eukprot:Sro706_g190410.1 monophosphate-protein transferase FICD homolog (409) ;mRNA; r:5704-6930